MHYTANIIFVGIVFFCGEIVSSCGDKGKIWDRLIVNFMKPSVLPRTVEDATKAGWTQDALCGGPNNPFYGNRYVLGDDLSTRLLFDSGGKLAGIQATITESDDLILSPTRPRPQAFVKDDHGHYLLTAYFISKPKEICNKGVVGGGEDSLVIQMGDVRLCEPRLMEIPQDEKRLEKTPWVKGKCFARMGVHYWYNISSDMYCDQFFPVFLLYDQASQKLKSFGWAVPADITSPFWEHPPIQYLAYFFQQVPKCLSKLSAISTQHVYLTDPLKLQCSRP